MGIGSALSSYATDISTQLSEGAALYNPEMLQASGPLTKRWLEAMQKSFAKTTYTTGNIRVSGTENLTVADYTSAPNSAAMPYNTDYVAAESGNTAYSTYLSYYLIDKNPLPTDDTATTANEYLDTISKISSDLIKQIGTLRTTTSFSTIVDNNSTDSTNSPDGLLDLRDLYNGMESYFDYERTIPANAETGTEESTETISKSAQQLAMVATLNELQASYNSIIKFYTQPTSAEGVEGSADYVAAKEAILPTNYNEDGFNFSNNQKTILDSFGSYNWNSTNSLAKLADFETKVNNIKTSAQAVATQYKTEYEAIVRALSIDAQNVITKYGTESTRVEGLITAKQAEIDAKATAIQTNQAARTVLEGSLATATANLATATSNYNTTNASITHYTNSLNTATSSKTTSETAKTNANTELRNIDATIATYQANIATAQRTIQSKNNSISAALVNIQSQTDSVATHLATILTKLTAAEAVDPADEDLQAAIDLLRDEHDDILSYTNAISSSRTALNGYVSNITGSPDTAVIFANANSIQSSTRPTIWNNASYSITSLADAITDLQHRSGTTDYSSPISTAFTAINTCMKNIQTQANLVSHLNSSNGYAKDIIDQCNSINTWQAYITGSTALKTAQDSIIATADSNIEIQSAAISTYNSQLTSLRADLATYSAAQTTYQGQINSYNAQITALNTTIASLEAEKTALQNDKTNLENSIATFPAKITAWTALKQTIDGLLTSTSYNDFKSFVDTTAATDSTKFDAYLTTLKSLLSSTIKTQATESSSFADLNTLINTFNTDVVKDSIQEFAQEIEEWTDIRATLTNLIADSGDYADFKDFVELPNATDLKGFNNYMLGLKKMSINIAGQNASESSTSNTINTKISEFNTLLSSNTVDKNMFITLRDDEIAALSGNLLFGLSYLLLCEYSNAKTITSAGMINFIEAGTAEDISRDMFNFIVESSALSSIGTCLQRQEKSAEEAAKLLKYIEGLNNSKAESSAQAHRNSSKNKGKKDK